MKWLVLISLIFHTGCSSLDKKSMYQGDEALTQERDRIVKSSVISLGDKSTSNSEKNKFESLFLESQEKIKGNSDYKNYYKKSQKLNDEHFPLIALYCFTGKNVIKEELKYVLSIAPSGKVRQVFFSDKSKNEISCLALGFINTMQFPAHSFDSFLFPSSKIIK